MPQRYDLSRIVFEPARRETTKQFDIGCRDRELRRKQVRFAANAIVNDQVEAVA